MTTRQRQWLLGGLLLLALVGLGGYLFEQLQPYQSTVKHGPSPEARRNPYLAAERGYVDRVIMPSETRTQVIRALRALRDKRQTLPPKKHGNIPL